MAEASTEKTFLDQIKDLSMTGNDEVRIPTKHSCSSCRDEGHVIEAVQYCIDCEEFQCGKCSKYHDRYNAGHDVLDGSKKMRWGEQKKTKLPTEKCPKHIGEVLQIYCENHEELCCHVCVAMEHSACSRKKYIPDVTESILDDREFKSLDEDINSLLTHIKNVVAESETNKAVISRSMNTFDQLVAKTRAEIMQLFDGLEMRSKQALSTESSRRIAEIGSTIGKGRLLLENLRDLQRKIDSKTTTNKAQLYINMKQTKKGLERISSEVEQMLKPQPKSIEFCVNEEVVSSFRSRASLFEHKLITWTPKVIGIQSLTPKKGIRGIRRVGPTNPQFPDSRYYIAFDD